MNLISIIFLIYLVFLLIVGIWTYSYAKTQEDYLLAGRRLGPWVTALSERASGESAWLLLALPGAAISVGLGESWAVIGIIIGIVIVIINYFIIGTTAPFGSAGRTAHGVDSAYPAEVAQQL